MTMNRLSVARIAKRNAMDAVSGAMGMGPRVSVKASSILATSHRHLFTTTTTPRRSTSSSSSNRQSSSLPAAFILSLLASSAVVLLRDDDSRTVLAEGAATTPSPYQGRNITDISEHSEDANDQVLRARANPSLFLWGNNGNKLVSPAGGGGTQRAPVAHPNFQGWVLRDVALSESRAAAVDFEGTVWEWGSGVGGSGEARKTLKGKKVVGIALTDSKTYAVGKDGAVWEVDYSIGGTARDPGAENQIPADKPQESNWLSSLFVGSELNDPNVRRVTIEGLESGERISSISAGYHHLLALSNRGRCFTLPADDRGNDNGQLGVGYSGKRAGDGIDVSTPALRPVTSLPRTSIVEAAAGADHNVVRTADGRAYGWGGNGFGQLATLEYSLDLARISTPREIWPRSSTSSLHSPTKNKKGEELEIVHGRARPVEMVVTKVATGEGITFLVGEAPEIPSSVEVMAAGGGIQGQAIPAKVRGLSNLSEYSESKKRVVPIRIYDISCGAGHCVATLDNALLDHTPGREAVEYGRDALIWGAGTSYQLNVTKLLRDKSGAITGREKRRTNLPSPSYMDGFYQGDLPDGVKGAAVVGRLQLAGKGKVVIKEGPGKGRAVQAEQKAVCGNGVTAIYMKELLA
ncbi:hypothetical protein HDU93_003656 [Gonapodya sp. JEL0774]|nr:hypothetical protein HDU93_003656 [Gonapodya sp. JEL0774]